MMKNRYLGNIKYVTAKDAYYKKKYKQVNFFKIFKFSTKNFKRTVFMHPIVFPMPIIKQAD